MVPSRGVMAPEVLQTSLIRRCPKGLFSAFFTFPRRFYFPSSPFVVQGLIREKKDHSDIVPVTRLSCFSLQIVARVLQPEGVNIGSVNVAGSMELAQTLGEFGSRNSSLSKLTPPPSLAKSNFFFNLPRTENVWNYLQ